MRKRVLLWRCSLTPGATRRRGGGSKAARRDKQQTHHRWDQAILLRGFGEGSKSWEDEIRRPSPNRDLQERERWVSRRWYTRKPVSHPPPRRPGSDSSSHHPRQQSNTCFNSDVITASRPPSIRFPGPETGDRPAPAQDTLHLTFATSQSLKGRGTRRAST